MARIPLEEIPEKRERCQGERRSEVCGRNFLQGREVRRKGGAGDPPHEAGRLPLCQSETFVGMFAAGIGHSESEGEAA